MPFISTSMPLKNAFGTFCFVLSALFWGPSCAALEKWKIDGALSALQDEHLEVKALALRKLIELNALNEIVDKVPLIKLARHPNPQIHQAAMEALHMLSAGSVKSLSKLLRHPEAGLRAAAALVLGEIGSSASAVVPVLLDLLEDKDVSVQRAALSALGKINNASEQIPHLVKALNDLDADVRGAAAQALGNMGAKAETSAAHLIRLLIDRSPKVRLASFQALRKIYGPADWPDYYEDLLRDENTDVRLAAIRALAETKPTRTDFFLQKFSDPKEEPRIRGHLAYILSEHGEIKSPRVLSSILQLSRHNDVETRVLAIKALGLAARVNNQALQRLLELLHDSSETTVYIAALEALHASKRSEEIVRKALKRARASRNIRIQGAAVLALHDILSDTQERIMNLAAFLQQAKPEDTAYKESWGMLCALGEAALPHVETLLQSNASARAVLPESCATAQYAAVQGLSYKGLKDAAAFLNILYENAQHTAQMRFQLHFLSGGAKEIRTLLKWLEKPSYAAAQKPALKPDEAVDILTVFDAVWSNEPAFARVRKELAEKMLVVFNLVEAKKWRKAHVPVLEKVAARLEKARPPALFRKNAEELRASIKKIRKSLELKKWQRDILGGVNHTVLILVGIILHIALWLFLLALYQAAPQTVGFLFWRKWPRNILGLLYINALLVGDQRLRTLLFRPYRGQLLALDKAEKTDDPSLHVIESPRFYGKSVIAGRREHTHKAVRVLLKRIHAYEALYRQPTVHLSAAQCKQGLVRAIHAKLTKPPKDFEFFKKLVENGAMHIILEDFHPALVDEKTRNESIHFLGPDFSAKVLVTTREASEWIGMTTAEIEPLAVKSG